MAHTKKNKTKAANTVADKAKNTTKATQKTIESAADATENAAKAAQATAAAAPRLSAIDSNVATSDQMLHAGTAAAKDFLAASTVEAQKTHEKAMSVSRDSIENLNKNAEKSARTVTEALCAGQEQIEALVESGKIASDLGRELQEKLVSEINDLFNENVELSKDMLACRTLNDLVEIQNRALQSNLSRFFDSSARLTDTWFKLATTASEPLNQQAAQTTSRINKSLAA